MPYGNTIDKVTLKGEHLWEVLEASVTSYEEGTPNPMFLQVSGSFQLDSYMVVLDFIKGLSVIVHSKLHFFPNPQDFFLLF